MSRNLETREFRLELVSVPHVSKWLHRPMTLCSISEVCYSGHGQVLFPDFKGNTRSRQVCKNLWSQLVVNFLNSIFQLWKKFNSYHSPDKIFLPLLCPSLCSAPALQRAAGRCVTASWVLGTLVHLVPWYVWYLGTFALPNTWVMSAVSELTCSGWSVLSFQLCLCNIPDRASWHLSASSWRSDGGVRSSSEVFPGSAHCPRQPLQLFPEQCFNRAAHSLMQPLTPEHPACPGSTSDTWAVSAGVPCFSSFSLHLWKHIMLPCSLLIHRGHDHRVQGSLWMFLMHIGSLLI